MIKYEPVPLTEHDNLLGANFANNFAQEMKAYYAPFLAKNRKIQLAKETWEYGVADSIPGAQWCGSGNSVVDVTAPLCSLDVKGLSAPNLTKVTTEASFLQNLQKGADGYSQAWHNQDWTTLKNIFVDPLGAKTNGINNLHLLVIVRTTKDSGVHYGLLKAVPNNLTNEQFIAQMHQHAGRSVNVPIIDQQYGRTYICISKRRLELRINCEGFAPFLQFSHHSK